MNSLRIALLGALLSLGVASTVVWALAFQAAATAQTDEASLGTAAAAQSTIEEGVALTASEATRLAGFLANDPRFLLALSTRPIDPATVQDALEESGGANPIDAQILGLDGARLAQTTHFLKVDSTPQPKTPHLMLRDTQAVVVAAAPIARGSAQFGTVVVQLPVPASLFAAASSAVKGGAGLSSGQAWVGGLRPAGAIAARVLAQWPDVKVEVTRPAAGSPPAAWVPLIIVTVTSLGWVLLTWLHLRRKP